jgi:hypothetical protein
MDGDTCLLSACALHYPGTRLSDIERDILGCLDNEWVRPMDIGGSDGSRHSHVLAGLVKMGLVERKLRGGSIAGIRGSYVYRLATAMRSVDLGSTEGGKVEAKTP